MMRKSASVALPMIVVACVAGLAAQSPNRTTPAGTTACSALKGRSFDGDAKVVDATPVTGGTLTISDTVTIPNLPVFCRVQAISKPSADSNIHFEVWLPDAQTWNRKFLSTGEGGFAGQLNYGRNGLDSAMDELVRRGYATASTDTGHLSSDPDWAIGHPERITDYLYRAKHVTTVAAKAIISA